MPHRGRIPFVGRRKELDRLAQHRVRIEGTHERGRHLILIEGFSGVGKTACAEEFLTVLDQEGRSFTLKCAYNPHLRRPPLAPILDAVDEFLCGRFPQRRLLSFFTDTTYLPLATRLPMLSNTIGLDSRATAASATSPDMLAALIASLLLHAARFRPVAFLIEDIQWMPEEDVNALYALNAGLRNAPVLLVATMRREAAESEALREGISPVMLDQFYMQPLATEDVAELLTGLYGARVSAKLAADLTHASEGLPFRALEHVRRLIDQGVLLSDAKGAWRLDERYHPRLLAEEPTSEEKLRRLDPAERLLLLLLDCAGGEAGRDELITWAMAMPAREGVPGSRQELMAILERLEANMILKPVYSNPDQVMFAHDGMLEAEHQLRPAEDVHQVAAMLASNRDIRGNLARWTYDADLLDGLMENLPPIGSAERAVMMDTMVGPASIYTTEWDIEHRARVYATILDKRDKLSLREYTRTLAHAVAFANVRARFDEAVALAEELYQLVADPSCADLRAEACVLLGAARFYNDRSTNVTELLQEAWQALGNIEDVHERMRTELQITRIRAALVPVGRPQEAITQMRRGLYLAEQLGIEEEKQNILNDLVIRLARLRDEESLRYFCSELLKSIEGAAAGGARPPFTMVCSVVRAALIAGDIFMARKVFESLLRCSAPLTITEFVAYSYLTTLFAYADGAPALAADSALNAREEILRHRAAAKSLSWEFTFHCVVLQVQIVPSLLASGRYVEALGLAETMYSEIELEGTALPDVQLLLNLYRTWLRWRCMLPVDAPISLCWHPEALSSDGGADRFGSAYDPAIARQAGEAFRKLYADIIDGSSPPPRFIAEMLLAMLENAERNYPGALAAIERAAAACEQLYDWQKELECKASAITMKLRWAQAEPELAPKLVEESLDETRELFTKMSEKGLAARITQLAALFRDESQPITGISHRDLPAQFDRLGATAHAAAHAVVRNSRSEDSGPIERSRLFVMGPLRLMRPHSYMELGESVFGREAARTLLTALVVAEVLDRAPTREELALQVAPKARTPEQQKKALYNAASAARAACASPNSILAVGPTGLELNTNPELEGSVWVDALEILRYVRNGGDLERGGQVSAAFDEFNRALLLARKGDFASDTYAEWVDAARDRLREVVRQAALAVARIALRSGLYAAGIEAISGQLTRDPYDEEAHRALIRLYNESGNRSAALKQLDKCRKLIKKEFGVEPEPETVKLRQEIVGLVEEER
jgi:DNA-binding SARP family transcriptional activator